MKINFTKKRFEALLKLAYMGNWVVNEIYNYGIDRLEIVKDKKNEK